MTVVKIGGTDVVARLGGSSAKLQKAASVSGFDSVSGFVPIARWDFVPRQSFVDGDTIRPGVVAETVNEIASVKFYQNGSLIDTVLTASTNPDSGQSEYWTTIDTTGMSTGAPNSYEGNEYTLTAIIEDSAGQTRTLSSASGFDYDEIKFRVVASKITYWMEPGASGGDGSELSPFGNVTEAFAAYETLAGYGTAFGDRNAPLVLMLKPGTYTSTETKFLYPENAFNMRTAIEFRNPSATRSDVVLSGEIGEPNIKPCFRFVNLEIDASDPKGDGSEVGTDPMILGKATGDTTDQIIFYDNCRLTCEKTKSVSVNGSVVGQAIPILRYINGSSISFGVDCEVYNFGAKPFMFARSCTLERILEDAMGSFCALSCSVTDLTSTLTPRGYVDDLHGDVWQDFHPGSVALPKENIFIRDLTCVRCHSQGLFLSGGVSVFDGLAVIDCDWTNTYVPVPGQNGVVDQVALADDGTYDNSQIKNLFLGINAREDVQNAIIRNSTFRDNGWLSQNGGAFDSTLQLFDKVYFVDCSVIGGGFFVAATRDGQAFASQAPDMSAPFSEWRAPTDSITGSGAYYRTTTGI